jgi:hypothetical protein
MGADLRFPLPQHLRLLRYACNLSVRLTISIDNTRLLGHNINQNNILKDSVVT